MVYIMPDSATSSWLSAALTSFAVWRSGELQHLSETLPHTFILPTVRALSGTVNAPPGRTDAVLLSLRGGRSVCPSLPENAPPGGAIQSASRP